jgi:hypothetical protein
MKPYRVFIGLLAVLVSHASSAMTLSPGGSGQVLLFPYYTVNKHQQTLVVVTNTTSNGKVLAVRIREGYNGRAVLNFSVFLAPHDSWSGATFSPSDAGISGNGAAIVVSDHSCTIPSFASLTTTLSDGRPYQPFLSADYTDANADTGPTDDTRTREGSIEIFEMAELNGETLQTITGDNGPPNCQGLTADVPAGDLSAPRGGLVGAASIVNVSQGTFFSTNAYAIDGFFNAPTYFADNSSGPTLNDASVQSNGFVTANIPINGSYVTLNYPPSQSIDAVSALLMAGQVYGDWDITANSGANTDWVVTFPTKRFYVDPALNTTGSDTSPFAQLFGAVSAGRSDVTVGYQTFNRDGATLNSGPIGISPTPPAVFPSPLPYSTQVATFTSAVQANDVASYVLGSNLTVQFPTVNSFNNASTTGSAVLDLSFLTFDAPLYELRPSNEGLVVRGLPIIGFEAVNYVNSNVTAGVLSNYSGAYPLRTSLSCDQFDEGNKPAACN